MALAATPGAPLQLPNSKHQHSQLDFSIASAPLISWASSTPGASTTESRRYEFPLAHRAFDDDDDDDACIRNHRLVDDVNNGNIRTHLSDDFHITANGDDTLTHYGARRTRLNSSKNGGDMLNLHGSGDGKVSLKAQSQQKCRHLGSHLYPHGQSSCHENRLLQTLCNDGHLEQAMDVLSHVGTSLSTDAYLSLLRLCHKTKSLTHLKDVCTHLVQHRTQLNGYLGDFLVTMLAKCGAVEEAQEIANRLARRTVYSWTAIISAYVNRGEDLEALKVYECMQKEGVEPDTFTLASVFKACASIQDLASGKHIHMEACKRGLEAENLVGNSLLSLYGKCGAIFEAENTFLALCNRDIVSWTAMLSAYLEQGQSKKALQLFRQMQEEDIYPNSVTCVIALRACVSFTESVEALEFEGNFVKEASLEIGQALHTYARRKELESDVFVGTTLLHMYGNCGSIRMAENGLSTLSSRSTVSWNAMLAAYVKQSCEKEALLLFRQMLEESMPPDPLAYVSAIQACSIFAEKEAAGGSKKVISLKIGRALHADVCMNDFKSDAFIATALVAMYGKCGSIEDAEAVFTNICHRDLVLWIALFTAYVENRQGEKALRLHTEMQKQQFVLDDAALMLSWTAMLSGFIEQEQGERALELHRQMQEEGVMLDDVALNCSLQACCFTGSLESCQKIHFSIVCAGYDLLPSISATLIHAYGNCASMVDAQAIFDKLSEPDMAAWNACLGGHAGDGNVTACMCVFEKLIQEKIMPDDLAFSAILSVCCHAGLVARGLRFFDSMIKNFGVAPNLKHYGIVIDLLGRAGDFNHLVEMLERMPLQPDLTIWLCLQGACQTHGNVELASFAFNHALNLQPQ